MFESSHSRKQPLKQRFAINSSSMPAHSFLGAMARVALECFSRFFEDEWDETQSRKCISPPHVRESIQE